MQRNFRLLHRLGDQLNPSCCLSNRQQDPLSVPCWDSHSIGQRGTGEGLAGSHDP